MPSYLVVLFLALNVFSFSLMGIDKRRARQGAWRISERALLLSCACFGALGGLAGMRLFHHKTRHARFAVGVPLMLLAKLALLLWGFMTRTV